MIEQIKTIEGLKGKTINNTILLNDSEMFLQFTDQSFARFESIGFYDGESEIHMSEQEVGSEFYESQPGLNKVRVELGLRTREDWTAFYTNIETKNNIDKLNREQEVQRLTEKYPTLLEKGIIQL